MSCLPRHKQEKEKEERKDHNSGRFYLGVLFSSALLFKLKSYTTKKESVHSNLCAGSQSPCSCTVDLKNLSLTGIEFSPVVSLTGQNYVSLTGQSVVSLTGQSVVSLTGVSLVSLTGQSVVSLTGQNYVSLTGVSLVSLTGQSVVSLTGVSLVSLTGQSVVSLTGQSVVSLTGQSVVSLTGQSVVTLSNNQSDAFGRLRVSETFTLLDMSNTVGKNPSVIDESVSAFNASSTFNQNNSCVDMTVTASNGRVLRQSRRYCIYQPGKSLLIQLTGVLNSGNNPSYITTRCGYFDDNNGYFFENSDGTLKIVERSFVSGAATDVAVAQANWNINPLLVNSSTSYILDVTKAQIFIFDFQWLGVGRVRCGVVHNGIITYVHEFEHDNIITQTYTTTMNLPIRYEILGTGVGLTGTGSLRQICATAISEGGYNPVGQVYSIARDTSISVNSTEIPLLAIRIKSPNNTSPALNRNRTNVIPGVFDILTGNNNDNLQYYVRLFRSPADAPFTGSPTWIDADSTNSAVQYFIPTVQAFSTTAGSVIINSGFLSGKTSKSISADVTYAFSENNQLTCNIAGLSDYFVLSANNLGGPSINTRASLDWREIF